MNTKLTLMAILAIAAGVGAVGVMTSVGFVQEAQAASCQAFFDADTGESSQKCSSDNSFQHANAQNFNNHVKNTK
jgi:ABC-type antimicrobial peptide transport system permease subunit